MSTPRFNHSATLLPDGKVLVAGGCSESQAQMLRKTQGFTREALVQARVGCASAPLDSAEIYDPARGGWSPAGKMVDPTFVHAAVLLPSTAAAGCGPSCGKVLLVGQNFAKDNESRAASAQLFDPSTRTWTLTAAPGQFNGGGLIVMPSGPRSSCGRRCGKIMILRGHSDVREGAIPEFYDPAAGTWEPGPAAPLLVNGGNTLTLLKDGKVLVLGGVDMGPQAPVVSSDPNRDPFRITPASPAVYDPVADSWRAIPWQISREFHTATRLKDGRVLVAAGMGPGSENILSSAELFSWPGDGRASAKEAKLFWTPVKSMKTSRHYHRAALLADGRVLVLGGDFSREDYFDASTKPLLPGSEIYDPAAGAWAQAPSGAYRGPTRPAPDAVFTATLLSDGRVLAAGGIGQDDSALASAELFTAPARG